MNQQRIFSFALIVLLWVSATGFAPQAVGYSAAPAPALAPQPSITKIAPADAAANVPLTGVVLRWQADNLPANTIFQYCLRTNKASCPPPKWVDAGTATQVTLPALQPNLRYNWQVRAVDATTRKLVVEADAGKWFAFRTLINTSLPGDFQKIAPANVASGLPVNGTQLVWSASTGANSYQYCYDTLDNDVCDLPGGWVSAAAATTATIANLEYETPYYWQVRAVNAAGSLEADSGAWDVFITQVRPPAAFGKTAPANAAFNRPTALTLTWQASAGSGVTYEYCLDTVNDDACGTSWTGVSGLTSAPVSGLAYGQVYYWQVRATNASGSVLADGGTWFSFATQLAPPGSFGKLQPGNGAAGQNLAVTLSWQAAAGEGVSYEYCFTPSSAPAACDPTSGVWTPTGSATSAAVSGLAYAAPYTWQVRARNGTGVTYANGAPGAVWTFTTLAAPPAPFNKLSPQPNAGNQPTNLRLSWSDSAGMSRYEYCLRLTSGTCPETDWVDNGTNTSVDLGPLNLEHEKTYYWQVRAANSTGTTPADGGTWRAFTTVAAPAGGFEKISPDLTAAYLPLQPDFYWTASSGSDPRYQYCVSTENGNCLFSWVDVGTSTTARPAAPLLRDTQYYWQVRAYTSGDAVNGPFTYANNGSWYLFNTLPPLPSCGAANDFSTIENTPLVGAQLNFTTYSPVAVVALYGAPPAGSLTLSANGSFNYTPAANFASVAGISEPVRFQFTVFDGYNPPTAPCSAAITVTNVNQPPVFNPLPDTVVVKTGTQISFFVSATDADMPYGDQVTLSVEAGALPPGAAFDAATGVFSWRPTWSPSHPGPYEVTFTAKDKSLAAVTRVVQIVVTPHQLTMPVVLR